MQSVKNDNISLVGISIDMLFIYPNQRYRTGIISNGIESYGIEMNNMTLNQFFISKQNTLNPVSSEFGT